MHMAKISSISARPVSGRNAGFKNSAELGPSNCHKGHNGRGYCAVFKTLWHCPCGSIAQCIRGRRRWQSVCRHCYRPVRYCYARPIAAENLPMTTAVHRRSTTATSRLSITNGGNMTLSPDAPLHGMSKAGCLTIKKL